MSNLPIMDRNIIHGLASEVATASFLRARDRVGSAAAEAFAYEVRHLVDFLDAPLMSASAAHELESVPDGLLKFILDRHWNLRFPERIAGATS